MKLEVLKKRYEEMGKKYEELGKEIERLKSGNCRYIPDKHKNYWYYDFYHDEALLENNTGIHFDIMNIDTKNCFRTKEEAEEYREYVKAKEKYVHKFTKEEWENDDICKSYLCYDYEDKEVGISNDYVVKQQGTFYFTKEDIKEFIEKYEPQIKKFEFGIYD